MLDDATGLLVLSDVDRLKSSAEVEGDVVVNGTMGSVQLKSKGQALTGDVWIAQGLGGLKSSGAIQGDLTVGGNAGKLEIKAKRGQTVGGCIDVAGNLTSLKVSGCDFGADLTVGVMPCSEEKASVSSDAVKTSSNRLSA